MFEPNLTRLQSLLRARRDAMLEALESDLSGIATWSRPEGGYFLWLDLPEDLDGARLLARAEDAGVTFVAGADFGGRTSSARLAYSFVSPDEIRDGVRRLAAVMTPVRA
jgi:DNA-binding transcriptional MocR family regulator